MRTKQDERRLADASAAYFAARDEYEKAVAASAARPKPAAGWREAQARAVNAAVALGEAEAKLDCFAAALGRGPKQGRARSADDKVLVSVVRVPARVAAALAYGPGSLRGWIDTALGVMFEGDLDDDGNSGAWSDVVRSRFGVTNAAADAFDTTAAAFLASDCEEARAVVAIVEGMAECFPDADKEKGGGMGE